MKYASMPPVLNPALSEAESVRRAQRDLDTLMAYAAARTRAKPVTTLSSAERPSVVLPVPLRVFEITACIVMPALEYAARLGIARWQEAETERSDGL